MSEVKIKSISTVWDDLCKLVIRPHRQKYDPDTALGLKLFSLNNKIYQRTDLQLINERKLKIECSHFEPITSQRTLQKLPCVIYCHGNSGSRLDALTAVQLLLPLNITVFAFDFSGSGLSEGNYVSLGYYEKDDVKTVVEHLRKTETVSRIALWGRSMGAATSIMYASLDQSICGVVADSPFTSLEDIIVDLVQSYKSWIPKSAIKIATNAMRSSIQSKANFDISKLNPIEYAKTCFIPALFAHADGDNFIKPKQSQKLYEEWSGDKNRITFDGDHNSNRPDFFYDSVGIFFYNCLVSNDKNLEDEKNKPKENVLISKKLNIGTPTKKSKILEQENNQKLSEEIKDEEEESFDFQSFDRDKELELIKQALIESINDSLSKTKDEKEIQELKKRLEEVKDKKFKFEL